MILLTSLTLLALSQTPDAADAELAQQRPEAERGFPDGLAQNRIAFSAGGGVAFLFGEVRDQEPLPGQIGLVIPVELAVRWRPLERWAFGLKYLHGFIVPQCAACSLSNPRAGLFVEFHDMRTKYIDPYVQVTLAWEGLNLTTNANAATPSIQSFHGADLMLRLGIDFPLTPHVGYGWYLGVNLAQYWVGSPEGIVTPGIHGGVFGGLRITFGDAFAME